MENITSNKQRKTKGAFWRKFLYAFKGIGSSLREESSLVVHFIATVVVFILGGILHNGMEYYDWIILIVCMLVLISGELINTAIENLTDMVSFKFSYNAKKIKDISAAAMLILSIMSIIVSLMILIKALFIVIG